MKKIIFFVACLTIAPVYTMKHGPKKRTTLLHRACRKGNIKECKLLLKLGAPVDVQDKEGFTPLSFALFNKNKEMVETLLSAGADPNLKLLNVMSPLDIALIKHPMLDVSCEEFEICEALINAGADPNDPGNNGVITLHRLAGDMHYLAKRASNTIKIGKFFINVGADPNAQDNDGKTPLHILAMTKNDMGKWLDVDHHVENTRECCNMLLSYSAHMNIPDKQGKVPLHYALKAGNNELALLLIRRGANVLITDNKKRTALYWAAKYSDSNICSALITNSIPPTIMTILCIYKFCKESQLSRLPKDVLWYVLLPYLLPDCIDWQLKTAKKLLTSVYTYKVTKRIPNKDPWDALSEPFKEWREPTNGTAKEIALSYGKRELAKLLDPDNIEQLRPTIEKNMRALLKPKKADK